MIKLVKMNLFRMLHTKCTYVILLSLVITVTFFGLLSKFTYDEDEYAEQAAAMEQMEEEARQQAAESGKEGDHTAQVGLTVDPTNPDEDAVVMDYAIGNYGILLVFVAIFASLFVSEEESSGFIKNIARQTKNKRSTVLAKLPVLVLFSIAVVAVYIVSQIIVTKILFSPIELGIKVDNIAYIGVQMLLASGFASLVACITTVCKSSAMGIVGGILLSMNFASFLTAGVELIIDDAIDCDKYIIVGNVGALPLDIVTEDYIRAIVVAAAWFIIWSVLSVLAVEKRDTV